nr:carcinoembryonic antigen-related cell adhesion molecule 3-like isoform X2 [Pogona vitticeps]
MPKSLTPSKEARPAYGPYLGYKGPSGSGTSWPMFLLAGHILSSSCFLLTRAENITIPVTSDPWLPLVGTEVTILPAGDLNDVIACSWYRGEMADQSLILTFEPSESKYNYGKAYTKRETLKERCSLHINNLTMQDSGFYSVLKQKGENKASEIGKVFLLIAEQMKQKGKLTAKAVAGIIVGTLLGVMGVTVLLVYQTSRTSGRILQIRH